MTDAGTWTIESSALQRRRWKSLRLMRVAIVATVAGVVGWILYLPLAAEVALVAGIGGVAAFRWVVAPWSVQLAPLVTCDGWTVRFTTHAPSAFGFRYRPRYVDVPATSIRGVRCANRNLMEVDVDGSGWMMVILSTLVDFRCCAELARRLDVPVWSRYEVALQVRGGFSHLFLVHLVPEPPLSSVEANFEWQEGGAKVEGPILDLASMRNGKRFDVPLELPRGRSKARLVVTLRNADADVRVVRSKIAARRLSRSA